MNTKIAEQIRSEALRLGYEQCGIISVDDMREYTGPVNERLKRFPFEKPFYEWLLKFADPAGTYPWAKSIVVCAACHGKYRIPEHLKGLLGKSTLTDSRHDEKSPEFKLAQKIETFMKDLGLNVLSHRDSGVTALRWAALKAGIGIIRKNNFFYGEHGSYYSLEAWLTDRDMELKSVCNAVACPENCDLCRKACPTQSLSEPYLMCRSACVASILTQTARELSADSLREKLGGWLYGCDACQDACPFNRGQITGESEYPGLEDLSGMLAPEKILAMDYETLRNTVQPKFWYISKEDAWRFKVNALNVLLNSGDHACLPHVEAALTDEYPEVRKMAEFVLQKLDF